MAGEFTYDKIKPLVATAQVWGSQMSCTFKCPVSGDSVQSSAEIESLAGKMAAGAVESVKHSVWWSIRSAVSNAIWSSAGSGVLGRTASDAASTVLNRVDVSGGTKQYSEKARQDAIIAAFKTVSGSFRWDEAANRWVGAGAAAVARQQPDNDFTRQLQAYPIRERYDQGILARLLVALAAADQQVTAEERQFLAAFIDPSLGSIDDLMQRPAPSKVEIEETSSGGARETILMVCWGMALADENLEESEAARMSALAGVLGVGDERASELKRFAQAYVLEQAIAQAASGGRIGDQEMAAIQQIGTRIGLSVDDAERAIVQYRKRAGLF